MVDFFRRPSSSRQAKPKGLEAGTRRIDDLFSAKAEELSLFSPAGRQPRRQAHQCLGGELRWFSAIDDGRGDVGRQPGKTQKDIKVGCRHLLLASDIMHGQLGVLDQTRLDVVSARNDSEQAGIG